MNEQRMREEENRYLNSLNDEQKQKFYAMSEEKRKRCITENILGRQDEEMWEKNEGISQLEHRINTESFQG